MGLEEPGKGLGVDWEGNLIYNLIYHRINKDKPSGSRFIPILLPGSKPDHIPTPILGHTRYQIASFDFTDPGFEALYRHLTDQPAPPRPELGPTQKLPPKSRPQPSPGPLPPSGGPGSDNPGPAVELERDQQLAMIDLNVRALTDLSLRWIDSIGRHGGGILNVASVVGFMPGPAWPYTTPPRPTC